MSWSRRSLLSFALLFAASSAAAAAPAPGLDELAEQLKNGPDFRLRVAAALQLGKSLNGEATELLVGALDDPNAAVRAAAATALKNLGEMRALGALRAHRADKSEAVRTQVSSAIQSLEDERATGPKPKVLVTLGIMKNGSGDSSQKIATELTDSSRRRLGELPGVKVLAAADRGSVQRTTLPLVLVTGNVQELRALREGSGVTFSAIVEYVLHTMPEQAIAARVSGRARATASTQEARDSLRFAELRQTVLEAAIASALRRAPPALMVAARL